MANLNFRVMPRGERISGNAVRAAQAMEPSDEEKGVSVSAAWREARELVWAHRRRLGLGLGADARRPSGGSGAAGLVQMAHRRSHRQRSARICCLPLALAAGAATLVQAVTAFALSQILGVAAQRAITDMRKRVQERVMRLPVRYFDSTQTGVLVSRIMTDAEGRAESRRHRASFSSSEAW